jgi:hypothetical protein
MSSPSLTDCVDIATGTGKHYELARRLQAYFFAREHRKQLNARENARLTSIRAALRAEVKAAGEVFNGAVVYRLDHAGELMVALPTSSPKEGSDR